MKNKIVDCKGRSVDKVIVYTGIVPKGVDKAVFKKKNTVRFPKGGFYLSTDTFFSNVPPDAEGYVTFKPQAAKSINIGYRGMQFIEKGDVTAWMHFIEIEKVRKFNYIMGGRIDFELVQIILKHRGYDKLLYSYAYRNGDDTLEARFYYNKSRNVILKIETNMGTKGIVKLYCPKGILPPKLIFGNQSYLSRGWIGSSVDIRKMVKPSINKYNKNQLDYLEKEMVEIVRDL